MSLRPQTFSLQLFLGARMQVGGSLPVGEAGLGGWEGPSHHDLPRHGAG